APGLLLTGGMTVVVLVLDGTAAKIALGLSLPLAVLLYVRRTGVARIAAALAVAAVLIAPSALPRLAHLPALFTAADAFKDSAGHRLMVWSFVGDRIAERPILGWGL